MNHIEHIRARTLSAPNCIFEIGDRVFVRRYPGDHEILGRVVGRTFGRHIYDVETADGETLMGLALVRLDEEAQRLAMVAEALA